LRFAGIRLPLADAEAISATVSIGVAEWRPGEDEQTLIRRADEAVYAAKRRGKNCVVLAG
jgi:diguanylate cyclase (GGDEF)-like protein